MGTISGRSKGSSKRPPIKCPVGILKPNQRSERIHVPADTTIDICARMITLLNTPVKGRRVPSASLEVVHVLVNPQYACLEAVCFTRSCMLVLVKRYWGHVLQMGCSIGGVAAHDGSCGPSSIAPSVEAIFK